MQDQSGVRRIAASRASSLPWLPPPAGYIILIQDVSYGNRYLIARHQRLDRQMMRRGADLPFETRVVQILEADNAAQAERDLYAELAPGAPAGEWFDLQRYPPAKPSPATQLGMASLRDLALNDVDAESLMQGAEIVDATARAPDPERPAASQSRALNRRRSRLSRWALLLVLIGVAGALAVDRSSDFRRAIHSILRPSPQPVSSRRAAHPTTKPGGADLRAGTPATAIKLSQPELLLAERTETYIRINWYKMPQALSYQYRYSVNGGAYSGWKTVKRFTYKLEGLSPGDRVTFRLRARRDGVYSPLAQIFAQTLPAPTATSIPPIASSTSTDPPPTATPVPPTADARGDAFYAKTAAYVRRCARLSCEIVEILPAGGVVTVEQFVDGQRVDGSDRWIRTSRNSRYAYVHSGSLTSRNPKAEVTPQPTLDGGGEVYYVKTRTPARTCPRSDCERAQSLPSGLRIVALGYVEGQPLAGDSRWIRFVYGGWDQFVHVSALSKDKPVAEPTATATLTATYPPSTATSTATITPEPTATATVAPAVKYVVETAGNLNANIRACPSTTCAVVANFAPGTAVDVIGSATGETVYGTDVWLEISLDGGSAFIHSELVAEAE